MKEKDKFRYAEKCMYKYMKNLACLKILKDDLKIQRAGNDVHAQNYESAGGLTGEPSSPVHSYVVSVETLECRIRYLERQTKPITNLLEDLNSTEMLDGSKKANMMQILTLMYFGENKPKQVIEELKMPKRTFTRRRNELVHLAIAYLGL